MEKLKLKAVLLKLMAPFLCIQLDRCSVRPFFFFFSLKEFVIFKANICYRKIKNTRLKEKAITPPSR